MVPDDDLPEIGDEARNRLVDVYLPDAETLEPVMGRLPPWVKRDHLGRVAWRGR